jgi:aminopeptidase-like protein
VSVEPAVAGAGEEVYALAAELFPICRSITGNGVRQSFELLAPYVDLQLSEVPTGTQVFDWVVPREWNIREGWINGPDGRRVVDFSDSNLHVLNYSTPVRARLGLDELRPHLFTHPDEPAFVPYRTSYYSDAWGFCLSAETLESLPDGEYEVCIDSTLADGSLTYAEAVLPGETDDEVLISTYSCHPSVANDNVSGIALVAVLGRYLSLEPRRRTYRLLFSPGSIGPIAWLARNEAMLDRIGAGLVVSCVGDPGPVTYKRSRRGNAEIDRAAAIALRDSGRAHRLRDFVPLGGDERQFCSPGIDLPVGAFSRTPAGEYAQYHSSADDLDFVRPEFLGESLQTILSILGVLERNRVYLNTQPKGEPQLGKRGLYRSIGGGPVAEAGLLWVLNRSDGSDDLVAIAERSGLPFDTIAQAADALLEVDLLAPA